MDDYKMTCIINDYMNGNLTAFKKAVKRMSKKDFLDLILVMQADGVDLILLSKRI